MNTINTFINRVVHGDCTEVMRGMPQESIDLIVTDPPYLVAYRSRDGRTLTGDDTSAWLEPSAAAMYRLLKPNRYCVSFYGWHKVEQFMAAWKRAGFRPVGHFVFVKQYASSAGHTRYYHENAYLLAKGRPRPSYRPIRDVLRWRYTGNLLHPTEKPVYALLPLIRAYSDSTDIVLDPFAGSGSTAIAALELGRRFIAIEKDARYYRSAAERIREYTRSGTPVPRQDMQQPTTHPLAS
jgi:adenine-specific DNA-methyltransferase